ALCAPNPYARAGSHRRAALLQPFQAPAQVAQPLLHLVDGLLGRALRALLELEELFVELRVAILHPHARHVRLEPARVAVRRERAAKALELGLRLLSQSGDVSCSDPGAERPAAARTPAGPPRAGGEPPYDEGRARRRVGRREAGTVQ